MKANSSDCVRKNPLRITTNSTTMPPLDSPRHTFKLACIPPKDAPPNQFYRVHAKRVTELLSQCSSSVHLCLEKFDEHDEQKQIVMALKTPMNRSLNATPRDPSGGLVPPAARGGPDTTPQDKEDVLHLPTVPNCTKSGHANGSRRHQRNVADDTKHLVLPSISVRKPPGGDGKVAATDTVVQASSYESEDDSESSDDDSGGGLSSIRQEASIAPSAFDSSPSEYFPPGADETQAGGGAERASFMARRESRVTEGQRHAAKKAAARVIKVMFCINMMRSSRIIQFFNAVDPGIVQQALALCVRKCRRRLNKADFLELVKRVAEECDNMAHTPVVMFNEPPHLSKPQLETEARTSTSEPPPSNALASSKKKVSVSVFEPPAGNARQNEEKGIRSLRREDTDPLFALFDEEETGLVFAKGFRDKFFSIALASPSDIVERLIQLIFHNASYHTLETTISRFELQMISSLLREVFDETGSVMQSALFRMREKDREALVLYEAAHPNSTAFSKEGGWDESDVSQAAVDEEHVYLRSMVEQSNEERIARLRVMLAAVAEFPNELNHVKTGCLTIRELRELCKNPACRYRVMEDETVVGKDWRRAKRSFVKRSLRYDEVFLTLVRYLDTTSVSPLHATPLVKAHHVGHVVTATNMMRSNLIAGGSQIRRHQSTSSSVKRNSEAFDDDSLFGSPAAVAQGGGSAFDLKMGGDQLDDPIIAEAIQEMELKRRTEEDHARNPTARAIVGKLGAFGAALGNGASRRSVADISSVVQADLYRRTTANGLHAERFSSSQQNADRRASMDKAKSQLIKLLPNRRRSTVTMSSSTAEQQDLTEQQVLDKAAAAQQSEEWLFDPPEHGNPKFECRSGQIIKRTTACPEGKPLHMW